MVGMANMFGKTIKQSLQWLKFGDITPAGWLRTQMQRDIEQGFLGTS
jgi:hypothetical protein